MQPRITQQQAQHCEAGTVRSPFGTPTFLALLLSLSAATGTIGHAVAATGWWHDPRNLESLITQHPDTPWAGDRLPSGAKPAVEIPNAERPLTLAELTDLALRNSRAAADTGTFLTVAGANTSGLVLSSNDLSRAKIDVELVKDAPANAITRK
jgi:hypothetical protein